MGPTGQMMRLGAHESIAGGLHKAFDRAQSAGCEAVQIFVKSNRSWAVKPLTEEDIARFKAKAEETGIHPVVGHTSYLLNLATPDEALWAATPGFRTQILLETTAGQGSSLGHSFEHLAWLIEHTPEGERLGVCLDTCHVFAAGYKLRTPKGYTATMETFDRLIGLERLKALHLNDCKANLGSRKDRHEHIGKGHIGLEGFRHILNDPRLAGLPGLLETPKGSDLHEDRENLAVLRSLVA